MTRCRVHRLRSGPALGWLADDVGSITHRGFGSPVSQKNVVCEHGLGTLSLTVNETLQWLSPLPILMQHRSGGDNAAALGIVSPHLTSWDLGPRQYFSRDNSALKKSNRPTDRQTSTMTRLETDRQTDGDRHRERETSNNYQTGERQTDRQTDRQLYNDQTSQCVCLGQSS